MSISPFESAIHGALLSDAETAACFSDAAEIRAMLRVEAALARVQGRLGLIPAAAADAIAMTATALVPPPDSLAAGTASAGVPVVALVAALRQAVGPKAAPFVHWGATSQDILDSGLILRLREVLALQATRLEAVIAGLSELAAAQQTTVMAARTRSQQATPTTFGLKAAGWLAPLVRQRQRLEELKPRLLAVQLGGAAGTLAALDRAGLAVMEGLAAELELETPALPWHAQRDGLAELAGWFSLLTGSLGKMGQDLVLLGQSELGEVRAGPGGGSSTMPQKANPVAAETLVALARLNAGLLGTFHQSLVAEQERGGAAWTGEWLVLPQMAVAAGAALRLALVILEGLEVDPARMRLNLEASNGLLLAESASFALGAHLPRPAAQDLVKAACKVAAAEGRHLMDVLAERSSAPVDWQALKDPAAYLGVAAQLVERVLADARRSSSGSSG